MTHRATAALAVFALLALSLPALVVAHGDLVESDPADGATLTATPYRLTATFAEEIDPEASTLIVEDASGADVVTGSVNPDDPTMITAELPHLPDGVYTVRWTTVTPDDSGVERGTFTFTVAAASATPAPTPPPNAGAMGGSNDVLLALVLAAIGIGVIVLFVIVRSRR